MEDGSEHKKAKWTNCKDSSFNDEIISKSQQRFKSDHHKVYTEEVNKIALSSNDGNRLQTIDKVTTYRYGTNANIVFESEMVIVRGFFVKNYTDCPFYDEILLQQR